MGWEQSRPLGVACALGMGRVRTCYSSVTSKDRLLEEWLRAVVALERARERHAATRRIRKDIRRVKGELEVLIAAERPKVGI